MAKKDVSYKGVTAALGVLKCLDNESRLLIICRIIGKGELTVGELVEFSGLSPSALSQHLAILRQEEIVKTRKVQQMVYYSIADNKVKTLIETLHRLYC